MNGRGAGCVLHCRLDIEVERFIGNATKSGTPQAGSFFRTPLQPFFFSSSFFSSSSGHDAYLIVSPKTFKNQWKINVFARDLAPDLIAQHLCNQYIIRSMVFMRISLSVPDRHVQKRLQNQSKYYDRDHSISPYKTSQKRRFCGGRVREIGGPRTQSSSS